MDEIKQFLSGYWDFAMWHLIALGAIYVVTTFVLRRPGKAAAILLLGVYVTVTVHFLNVRAALGFTPETALGVVVFFGLAFVSIAYYFVFIRPG